MKKQFSIISLLIIVSGLFAQNLNQTIVNKYKNICREKIYKDYKTMFKEPKGVLKYPYITPGSSSYATNLWDWDSWFTGIALDQIVTDNGSEKDKLEVKKYEQGCVLNFLSYQSSGWIPIVISDNSLEVSKLVPQNPHNVNMHKPMLAQQAAFKMRPEEPT